LKNDHILQNLCEKVILPNVQIREMDEELFEDDPLDFVKKNLEGGGKS
jgi:exportin-2 (importin alpha re-exporter)